MTNRNRQYRDSLIQVAIALIGIAAGIGFAVFTYIQGLP